VMPVDVPAQEAVDAFLPKRPEPLQVVDPDDPRNIGPVTLADRRPDASGAVCPGYMELRAMHHEAVLSALDAVPEIDAEFGEKVGRTWGGLTWEYLLEDADVVLVAAGSLGTQLTVAAEQLRRENIKAGVLGIRCYRPFPAEVLRAKLGAGRVLALVYDKSLSYGYEGPICSDLRAALCGEPDAPPVWGAVCGLGGRDVSPGQLADAARRALADAHAGVRQRATDWLNLRLED